MKINFLTTNVTHTFLNKKYTENLKSNSDYQKEEFKSDIEYDNDFDDEFLDSNKHKANHQSKLNEIIILQNMLIDSLNYLSEQRLLISTLPEEINIKFTNIYFIDKFKSLFSKKDSQLAEVSFNSNTIYISTDLLNNSPKDQFLQEFSHKFQDKQSLIDAFFYHEFAHIIFRNTFQNIFNIYSQLTTHYPEIKKDNFTNTPLYQVLRNLEENFADSFSAFIHKNKHNLIDLYAYSSARNTTTKNNSLGYDLNINSLGIFFKQVNNISFNNNFGNNFSIDNICKELYTISLESILDVIKKTIKTNPQFETKLIENLTKLNCFNNNYTDSINTLLSLENPTTILTQKNTSDVKNRMFSIRKNLNSNLASTIQPKI
jgi:hypothetical protein